MGSDRAVITCTSMEDRWTWSTAEASRSNDTGRNLLDTANWCAIACRERGRQAESNRKQLPRCYAPPSTTHERFQTLVMSGFFEQLVKVLSTALSAAGVIDLSECFIDGMFVPAKKGALQ